MTHGAQLVTRAAQHHERDPRLALALAVAQPVRATAAGHHRVEAVRRVVHPLRDVRAAARGARLSRRPSPGTRRHRDRVRRAAHERDRRLSRVHRHRAPRHPGRHRASRRRARRSATWRPSSATGSACAGCRRSGSRTRTPSACVARRRRDMHCERSRICARVAPQLRAGFTADFIGRADGLPGLQRDVRLSLPRGASAARRGEVSGARVGRRGRHRWLLYRRPHRAVRPRRARGRPTTSFRRTRPRRS